jgi:hypothetical protein
MNLRFPIAVVAAGGLLAGSAGSIAAQGEDTPEPPVAVTACINPGPEVRSGTQEQIVVPLSDGEMMILQDRGFTFRQDLTEVSDPRLEGSLYQAWDEDEYILPGNEPAPNIVTFTDRIENDEGAWQGSVVMLRYPDDTTYLGPVVMVGEGAYEGLTAIVAFVAWGEDCAVRGYIIEGSVPAPPVPQTGQ